MATIIEKTKKGRLEETAEAEQASWNEPIRTIIETVIKINDVRCDDKLATCLHSSQ